MRFTIAVLITALLAVGSGVGALETAQPPTAPTKNANVAVAITPVLSPKRTPGAMLGTLRIANANSAVSSVVPSIPGHACVVVWSGEQEVFELRSNEVFTPASTLKLVVAHAVLRHMDPTDRFITRVVAETPTEDGVINGNLYIVGGGDPILETTKYAARHNDPNRAFTNFDQLADEIAAAGISTITGAVVGDGTRYDDMRIVPSWEPRYIDQVSAGPLSGLGVNDGLVSFTETEVASYPGVPATDPPANTAKVLTELLQERGIAVAGRAASGQAPLGLVEVAQISSPPLAEVVAQMLRYSDNTTAELLAKEVGFLANGEGSTQSGTLAMMTALADIGVDTTSMVINDGSGLDLGNRITCRALVQVLAAAGEDSPMAEALAVAGESGTLAKRMLDTVAAGNLRAKTGSLRSVSALAGFVRGDDGRTYTLAYIANNPNGGQITAGEAEAQAALAVGLASLEEVIPPAAILPVPVR